MARVPCGLIPPAPAEVSERTENAEKLRERIHLDKRQWIGYFGLGSSGVLFGRVVPLLSTNEMG